MELTELRSEMENAAQALEIWITEFEKRSGATVSSIEINRVSINRINGSTGGVISAGDVINVDIKVEI